MRIERRGTKLAHSSKDIEEWRIAFEEGKRFLTPEEANLLNGQLLLLEIDLEREGAVVKLGSAIILFSAMVTIISLVRYYHFFYYPYLTEAQLFVGFFPLWIICLILAVLCLWLTAQKPKRNAS